MSRILGMIRENEGKGGSLARLGMKFDAAAVGLRDVLDHGEADACSFDAVFAGASPAIEFIKDAGLFGGRNAGAVVCDTDCDVGWRGLELQFDG